MVILKKNCQLRPVHKRGISTIVGGLIFLILLTSGFSAFYIALEVQRDTVDAQRDLSDSITDKAQEKFEIAVSTDPNDNDRLAVLVKNTGQNPVEISNIWIVNKSEAEQPAKKILVNYEDAFIPPGYGADIFANNQQIMYPNEYDIKVVSTFGTIKKSSLSVGGNNYLQAELFTIPPDVRIGENVTVALRVTNTHDDLTLTNVFPKDNNPPNVDPVVSPSSEIDTFQFLPSTPVDLKPGESTIFTWQYTLKQTATVGAKVTFSHSANATDPAVEDAWLESNIASDKITIRNEVPGGTGDEIVLKDELFAKPEIFMIIPNTFGDDNEQAVWGITVANPTDKEMKVSKVTVSILFAGANDNQKILDTGCSHQTISPSVDYWSCPNQNQLVWQNLADPQTINPRSAYSFIAKVLPGDIVGPTSGLDSVVLHSAVFTTLGAFGKSAWTTSMSESTEALVNVYLSDVVDSTANADIKGSRLGIGPDSLQTFNIVLAEFNDSSQYIKAGTQLIINIPKEWNSVSVTDDTGFVGTPTKKTFQDGSTQIVGILEADLHTGGKTISFEATAPSPTCDKMYVMHVLANGETNNNKPIGPLAEVLLQVDGAGPCT